MAQQGEGDTEGRVDTRERLIAAGLDLFYQHGFHATALDRILAEVGTTKTTFYKYFESKDELARIARLRWKCRIG